MSTAVITIVGRRRRIGIGMHQVGGTMILSANSAFEASNIEKFFRGGVDITVNVNGGALVQYARGATRLSGYLKVYITSNLSTTGGPMVMTSYGGALSGTFTATGF
jgi:hypothetical protein